MRAPLWLRIFFYTIALLAVSQVLAFFLHNILIQGDLRQYFANSAKAVAEDLTDQPVETVLAYIKVSRHSRLRISLTNADGTAIPGQNFSRAGVLGADIVQSWDMGDMTLIEAEKPRRVWIMTPVRLREGQYLLFVSFESPPQPLRNGFLIQLFSPVVVVSFTLALWMAWRVSSPLHRLCDEVREMSETGPDYKVTATGKDEIGDVAKAVNAMVDSLARYIRGMRALMVNISHELRSPLARASLAIGIVEEALPPEYVLPRTIQGAPEAAGDAKKHMVAKYLNVLREELNHMDTLIETTLLVQKLEIRQEDVQMAHVDFSTLCADVCKRYEVMFERSGFSSKAAIMPGLTVMGNRTLLLQLLGNLLDNCLKYTSKGGEIRFSLVSKSKKAFLYVENSYDYVEESQLERIFDPFYRIDQATGTGVGLGLSLAQKTVQLHGGEIMAVSTDIGLCICIQFPLAPCHT
jgi:two-component system sensor histidine kinase CpxA